ncbi:isochorismatase family protein [Ornithinibacillus xuwenensis]|uniref:Isochorismatase family protein n=1 Tax=Ornithinibacillus xuwenensis TaxID=3144668 RepID=A0ABU9XIS2_9BACI
MNQALVIIDVQQELIDGNQTESGVYQKEQLIQTINRVIHKAIMEEVPIVFVRDLDVAEGKGSGFEIHQEITVPKDVTIFDKYATNCFHGTGLLDHLQEQKTEHIVIMGCKTQFCIDSAVRTATTCRLDVTLVGDGHSTTDNDVLLAEQIINHHNRTLHGHDNVEHFSLVRSSDEDLFQPTHYRYR